MTTKKHGLCRAVATASGDEIYSLHFELYNDGAAALDLPAYEPFTAFSVVATACGKSLTVHQPALDIPVHRTTIRVPPAATVTVHTPIRLRIAEGAEPGTNGFLWTIAHDRETVAVQIKLDLPAPFDVLCLVEFR